MLPQLAVLDKHNVHKRKTSNKKYYHLNHGSHTVCRANVLTNIRDYFYIYDNLYNSEYAIHFEGRLWNLIRSNTDFTIVSLAASDLLHTRFRIDWDIVVSTHSTAGSLIVYLLHIWRECQLDMARTRIHKSIEEVTRNRSLEVHYK